MNRFDRKIVSLSLICFLLTTAISFLLLGYSYSNENDSLQSESTPYSGGSGQSIYIKNPGNMIVDTIGEPETVDPHWAYDTASVELISNVYDTLVGSNREEIPVDLLAFELRISDGYTIPDGLTYRFHIRMNTVKWHDFASYGYVTPRDVEYSFERAILMAHGPVWMLTEPLLGTLYINGGTWDLTDPTEALLVISLIDNSIQIVDATGTVDPAGEYVQFNLANAYAPLMQILSLTWSSIIDKDWASLYTWDGIWPTTGADAVTLFATYTDPETSPFDDAGGVMMGAGPYTLTERLIGDHWKITRFADYYLGWPAAGAADWVETVQVNFVPSWATRKLRFLAGDADLTLVPTSNIPEVILDGNVRGTKDLPSLTAGSLFFNFAVPPGAPWMPKLGAADKGDLMSDWHMRKAFQYALDYAQYIQNAFAGEAEQPANPIIEGLNFYDPTDPKPTYDLTQAQAHFQAAWGGQVWTQGFTLNIVYNTGSLPKQIAAQMMETAIESLAPVGVTFDILPTAVAWSVFVPLLYSNQLPTFLMSWSADFTDPHSMIFNFMHPDGELAGHQNVVYGGSGWDQINWEPLLPGDQPPELENSGIDINNAYIAALIEEGIRQTESYYRNMIYRELANIYFSEAISVMHYQPIARHWELKWVQGWYYNPLQPGYLSYYFYHLWKGLNADINGDQIVDFMDLAKLNAWWWDGQSGSLGSYNRVADVWRPGRHETPIDNLPPGPQVTDTKADTQEMDGVHYLTGATGTMIPNSWEAFGIPAFGDGYVDVYDKGRINAEWGDTTQNYGYVHVRGPAKLAVEPPTKMTFAPFSVDITAQKVTGMLGLQFRLTYDTSVLTATGFGSYGVFSEAYDCSINDEQGYVSICYSWPFPEYFGTDVPAIDPPLPICWISFSIDNTGTSQLRLENSTIANVYGDPIGHEVFNGYYSSPPLIHVFPKTIIGPPPMYLEAFNVTMAIENITDLHTWQAGMTFNPSVLECIGIAEGEFLKRAGVPTLWTPGTINNTMGKIQYSACSITGPGPGVNGSGQLMSIFFRVINSGNSTLHLTDELLLNSNLTSITPITTSDGLVGIHAEDIGILSVEKSASEAYPTWTMPFKVTVVVENQGTRTETFNVTAFANVTEIGKQEITLAAGANTTLEFNWNLTSAAEGTYAIRAEATILYGEIDTADNALVDGAVKIKHPGDANDDMVVNAYDLGILAKAWTASGGIYDARADFNGDKTIDALDHDILKAYWP